MANHLEVILVINFLSLIKDSFTPPNTQQPKTFEKYEDHEQKEQPTLEVEDIVDSTGKLINQQPAYDQIINAEVQLCCSNEEEI